MTNLNSRRYKQKSNDAWNFSRRLQGFKHNRNDEVHASFSKSMHFNGGNVEKATLTKRLKRVPITLAKVKFPDDA